MKVINLHQLKHFEFHYFLEKSFLVNEVSVKRLSTEYKQLKVSRQSTYCRRVDKIHAYLTEY